jgi:hypothetical protein
MTVWNQRLWSELRGDASGFVDRFDAATVAHLPQAAQRFLTANIPDRSPLVEAVELEMSGRIKLGIWLPFTARQILRAGTGFAWEPDVGNRLLRLVGCDTLGPDGARMQFRLHDRITVVNASGPDVDRSAAGRLAAETTAWLPQQLTPQAGASWKPIDDDNAVVVLDGPAGLIEVEVALSRRVTRRGPRSLRWKGPPGVAQRGDAHAPTS